MDQNKQSNSGAQPGEGWQDEQGIRLARFQNNVSQAPRWADQTSNAYTVLPTPGHSDSHQGARERLSSWQT